MLKLKISRDFSDTLGGRTYTDGKFSGQEFFDRLLKDKFQEAIEKDEILQIDLDGTYGYPSSFLDQSFGELARVYGVEVVQERLKFISDDEIELENRVRYYINRGGKN